VGAVVLGNLFYSFFVCCEGIKGWFSSFVVQLLFSVNLHHQETFLKLFFLFFSNNRKETPKMFLLFISWMNLVAQIIFSYFLSLNKSRNVLRRNFLFGLITQKQRRHTHSFFLHACVLQILGPFSLFFPPKKQKRKKNILSFCHQIDSIQQNAPCN